MRCVCNFLFVSYAKNAGILRVPISDKLLPSLLVLLGERPSAAIGNLDRAERLGFIKSTDNLMPMRMCPSFSLLEMR